MNAYKASGVDIKQGDALSRSFGEMAKATLGVPGADIHIAGGFGGAFRIPMDYKSPVMVSGTDGVGSKLLLVNDEGTALSVGEDLVAMCANDIICSGAQPLFFLDYMAAHNLTDSEEILKGIMKGIVYGCRLSGMALVGGETAELKLMYRKGEFDLAGFASGIVEESELVNPHKNIRPGMRIIGLQSNGLHANGFSLVHKVIADSGINIDLPAKRYIPAIGKRCDRTMRHVLCTPTQNYASIVKHLRVNHDISPVGMAHITGGGLVGNIERILPDNCDALLNKTESWHPHPVFDWIHANSDATIGEMYRTFNMGYGFVMVVNETTNFLDIIEDAHGFTAWDIGEITETMNNGTRVNVEPT